MNRKAFEWAVRIIAVLALTIGTGVLAQDIPSHFKGVINDFTPASMPSTVMGPWEVRGPWSLELEGNGSKGNFSAALTMERSDAGVAQTGTGDLNDPTLRKAHTHHITLTNGTVSLIPGGFQVSGAAVITGNGKFPPPFGGNSSLVIQITGGTGPHSVTYSNIAVTFEGEAATHFGSNPIHGIVRKAE